VVYAIVKMVCQKIVWSFIKIRQDARFQTPTADDDIVSASCTAQEPPQQKYAINRNNSMV